MASITMYCTAVCPYCTMAERLLLSKGVSQIDKIRIDADSAKQAEMIARTGRRTVPQIFIDDYHVGGYDDLAELDQNGGLTPRLAK